MPDDSWMKRNKALRKLRGTSADDMLTVLQYGIPEI